MGPVTESGICKQGITLAEMSPQQLRDKTKFVTPMIIGRAKLSDGNELQQQLYETTLEEAGEKSWLEGPFEPGAVRRLIVRNTISFWVRVA